MSSILGFLGALGDEVTGAQQPGALSRISLNSNPQVAAQTQAQQLQNQQQQAALASMADLQKKGVTDPISILRTLATVNPTYASQLADLQAKNPLGFAMAGQNSPAPAPAAGQTTAPDPTILAPESPDDKRDYNFLNNKVPPQYRNLIRQISNGDESVGNADSLRSNGLLAAASNFDPSLNKTDFTARQKTAVDMSPAGKSGQGLKAINTATKHLAQVVTAGLDLNNSTGFLSQPRNYIANEASKINGQDPTTNLKSVVETVAPELAKAAASGGETTGDERASQAASFSPSMSPQQILGAAAGKVDLMKSKADEIGQSYKSTMGRPPKKPLIEPENQKILDDIKKLHELSQPDKDGNDKLDTPEAQAIVKRLRGVASIPDTPEGQAAPKQSSAPAQITPEMARAELARRKAGK